MISSEKSYGKALLFALVFAVFGGHRVYLKESIAPAFYYWFLIVITFTGIYWYDLWTLKDKVIQANLMHNAVFKNIHASSEMIKTDIANKINVTSDSIHVKSNRNNFISADYASGNDSTYEASLPSSESGVITGE